MASPFHDLNVYYGDLHNHCNVGYAHGSLHDAFRNARLQLDFVCVTPHAHWHDIPENDPRLASLVDYHKKGFATTARLWQQLKAAVSQYHEDGKFVTFLGFEWHSRRYGDHNIYFNGTEGEPIYASDMAELRAELRKYRASNVRTMLIPHHIGYKAGYRGINWNEFDPEFISVVEIMSMHGAAESALAARPYLHTMGPADWKSMLQYGLEQGHIVGVVASTDHHSAHPGSYGHGRLGVWADRLTREGIWNAICNRRTYALTGDRIRLAFSINGAPMGSILPPTPKRDVNVSVTGGDAIDYVEVLHNNHVIHRWNPALCQSLDQLDQNLKVCFEVGWGERGPDVDWQVELRVVDGKLRSLEPRFRGHEVVEPRDSEIHEYSFSHWNALDDNAVQFTTRTWGNPTTSTASTQGMCLEIEASPATRLTGLVNGQALDVPLARLLQGPYARYLGGFLSPAYCFHQAVPQSAYSATFGLSHESPGSGQDWYYLRVRQTNGHWAWSSPVWVQPAAGR